MSIDSIESRGHFHIRSFSLPSCSHPITFRIEEELKNLKILAASSAAPPANSICKFLSGLEILHARLDDFFKLPVDQQTLFKYQSEKWADKILDRSLRLLDISGNTMDIISQFKQHAQNLQSSFRTRKGGLSTVTSITKYLYFRKKMKKDIKKIVAALDVMDRKIDATIVNVDLDCNTLALMKLLMEVIILSISAIQHVLSYFSVPVKSIGWSTLLKMMQIKGAETWENQKETMNEIESLDVVLCSISRHGSMKVEKLQFAGDRLKVMETEAGGIENSLECVFRGLIRSRTSILNIISC